MGMKISVCHIKSISSSNVPENTWRKNNIHTSFPHFARKKSVIIWIVIESRCNVQAYSFTWKKCRVILQRWILFASRKQTTVILGCVALRDPCVQQLLLKALISILWTLTFNLLFLWRPFTRLSKSTAEQSWAELLFHQILPHEKQGGNLMNLMGDQYKPDVINELHSKWWTSWSCCLGKSWRWIISGRLAEKVTEQTLGHLVHGH